LVDYKSTTPSVEARGVKVEDEVMEVATGGEGLEEEK